MKMLFLVVPSQLDNKTQTVSITQVSHAQVNGATTKAGESAQVYERMCSPHNTCTSSGGPCNLSALVVCIRLSTQKRCDRA